MTEQQRAKRNQNPHRPAVVAMHRWGDRYARQNGGSMDFWDSLTDHEKRLCRETVKAVLYARDETDKEAL